MNQEERLIARAAVNRYRLEKARSRIRPKTKDEHAKIMAKVRESITPESREKARLARIGLKRSEESKNKMRLAAIGRKHTPETIAKIKEKRAQQTVTQAMKDALAANRGENSPLWKGPDVGYHALHRWVQRYLGKPETCEHCGATGLKGQKIHWASKSRQYLRDLSDWIRLCALCHKKYDKITS